MSRAHETLTHGGRADVAIEPVERLADVAHELALTDSRLATWTCAGSSSKRLDSMKEVDTSLMIDMGWVCTEALVVLWRARQRAGSEAGGKTS
jgi:hypothetical protein